MNAAVVLGQLAGRGLLEPAACLAALAAAAGIACPGRNAVGVRVRAAHALADAAAAEQRARARAQACIARALQPLLARCQPRATLLAAAAAAHRGVLSAAETEALVAGAVAAQLGWAPGGSALGA